MSPVKDGGRGKKSNPEMIKNIHLAGTICLIAGGN